jgi:hypothetical protein
VIVHVVIGLTGILILIVSVLMLRFRPSVEAFLRRRPFRFSPIWYTSLGVPILGLPLGAYSIVWAFTS